MSKPLESAPRRSPSDPEILLESIGHVNAFRGRYSTLISIDVGFSSTTPYGIFEVTELPVLELIQDCDELFNFPYKFLGAKSLS